MSTIEPRFTYAIELFFHSSPAITTINQFRAKLCKRILCLPNNSSNTAARYELGIDSAQVIAMTRACKFYWKKLNSNNNSILSNHIISNHSHPRSPYSISIKQEINKLGLAFLWNNFANTPLKTITLHIEKRIKDISRQNDVAEIANKTSLTFYKNLKTIWSTGHYISLNFKKVTIALSWARLGIFRLKNRRGIYPQNVCPLCNGIENLHHILLICVATNNLRLKYLTNLSLNTYSEYSCIKLLNSRNEETLIKTGRFLYSVKLLWENKTRFNITTCLT